MTSLVVCSYSKDYGKGLMNYRFVIMVFFMTAFYETVHSILRTTSAQVVTILALFSYLFGCLLSHLSICSLNYLCFVYLR